MKKILCDLCKTELEPVERMRLNSKIYVGEIKTTGPKGAAVGFAVFAVVVPTSDDLDICPKCFSVGVSDLAIANAKLAETEGVAADLIYPTTIRGGA